jgi:hypothetical protein
MRNKKIERQEILDEIDEEGFEEYCMFMYENCEIILKNKFEFIADSHFSPSFKCERIQELLDFFLLEEQYEKCSELHKIKEAVEIQFLFQG